MRGEDGFATKHAWGAEHSSFVCLHEAHAADWEVMSSGDGLTSEHAWGAGLGKDVYDSELVGNECLHKMGELNNVGGFWWSSLYWFL